MSARCVVGLLLLAVAQICSAEVFFFKERTAADRYTGYRRLNVAIGVDKSMAHQRWLTYESDYSYDTPLECTRANGRSSGWWILAIGSPRDSRSGALLTPVAEVYGCGLKGGLADVARVAREYCRQKLSTCAPELFWRVQAGYDDGRWYPGRNEPDFRSDSFLGASNKWCQCTSPRSCGGQRETPESCQPLAEFYRW